MFAVKNILPYILYSILILWSINDPFFWDTVQLGSKHAHFYYANGLQLQFLPDDINSGHIPIFGYYLALAWTIFGKTLMVSHLAMLPFALGIVYFMSKLAQMRFGGPLLFLSTLVLLFDPTLIAQVGLISPDLPLICFFLAALYYHHKQKSIPQSIFLMLMGVISMRGMFLVLCFLLFDLYQRKRLTFLFKKYLPAVGIIFLFFIAHYLSKGWIGFHSDSPWSESFAMDKLTSILKKPMIIFWRLIDFNRWFIFLVAFVLGMRLFKADRKLYLITSELYLLGIITLVFGLVGTFFSGLTAHRYFLPINILVAFYFLRMVSLSELRDKSKKLVLVSTILILSMGHLLIYPASVDQGWDASLAHKPYFSLRQEVDTYIEEKGLLKTEICTAFPDLAQGKYYKLDVDAIAFSRLSSNDCKYVMISNVHNDIEPSEFDTSNVVKEWKKRGVWVWLIEL